MTDELEKAVARAIYDAWSYNEHVLRQGEEASGTTPEPAPDWDAADSYPRELSMILARAALAAVEASGTHAVEPAGAMDALRDARSMLEAFEPDEPGDDFQAAWNRGLAIIDAALSARPKQEDGT